jgi:hypothetical protein
MSMGYSLPYVRCGVAGRQWLLNNLSFCSLKNQKDEPPICKSSRPLSFRTGVKWIWRHILYYLSLRIAASLA